MATVGRKRLFVVEHEIETTIEAETPEAAIKIVSENTEMSVINEGATYDLRPRSTAILVREIPQ